MWSLGLSGSCHIAAYTPHVLQAMSATSFLLNGFLMSTITRLFRRSEGQDLIEYALLASLVSVLAVVVLNSVGVKVSDTS